MDIKQICKTNFSICVDLLEKLVACKSLSGSEKDCAQTITAFFETHKIPCFTDSRGSIIAVSAPSEIKFCSVNEAIIEAKKQNMSVIVYNAHMDVVSADNPNEWKSDPFKLSKREGKLFGRGTCDMKGALAAMATSMALMKDSDKIFKRENIIIGCFCTEEEVAEGLAFKNLFDEFEFTPDAVILGEPSKMQVARGQRGKLEMVVETNGVCSHTSVPETADNAAYKMARALLAIEDLELEERKTHTLAPENIMQRTTIVGSAIRCYPLSKSFVPDKAEIHVTARLALGQTMNSISEKLKKHPMWPQANTYCLIYKGKSYTGKDSYWPAEHNGWETSKDESIFKLVFESYKELFGVAPKDKIWPFSTDGVYCAGRLKIPTLGIGPGHEEVAHINDEWVSEEELFMALSLYSALAYKSLNSAS
ncbi:MAG: M20/M25/M40 family metallo-hydrolase [Candidatus Riflebacteria bacterium]|nr:M20/M25/M40 family metallo-hydrolase [Candidatus Riflebacteria bacterium]